MNQISKQDFLSMIYDVMGTDNIDTSSIDFGLLQELNKNIRWRNVCDDTINMLLTITRFNVCDIVTNLCYEIIPSECAETVESYLYRLCNMNDDVTLMHNTVETSLLTYRDDNKLFSSHNLKYLYSTLTSGKTINDNLASKLDDISKKLTAAFADYPNVGPVAIYHVALEFINLVGIHDYQGCEEALIDFAVYSSESVDNILLNAKSVTNNIIPTLRYELNNIIQQLTPDFLCEIIPSINDEINNRFNKKLSIPSDASIDELVNIIISTIITYHMEQITEKDISWLITMDLEYHCNMVKFSVNSFIDFIVNKQNSLLEKKETDNMEIDAKKLIDECKPSISLKDMADEFKDMVDDITQDINENCDDNHVITDTIRDNLMTRINEILSDVINDTFRNHITECLDESAVNIPVCGCGDNCGCNTISGEKKPVARGTREQLLLHLTYNTKRFVSDILNEMDLVHTYESHDYYQTVLNVTQSVVFLWIDIYALLSKKFTELDLQSFDSFKSQLSNLLDDLSNGYTLEQISVKFTILKLMALDLLAGLCQELYDSIIRGYTFTDLNMVDTICDVIFNLSDIQNMKEWLE